MYKVCGKTCKLHTGSPGGDTRAILMWSDSADPCTALLRISGVTIRGFCSAFSGFLILKQFTCGLKDKTMKNNDLPVHKTLFSCWLGLNNMMNCCSFCCNCHRPSSWIPWLCCCSDKPAEKNQHLLMSSEISHEAGWSGLIPACSPLHLFFIVPLHAGDNFSVEDNSSVVFCACGTASVLHSCGSGQLACLCANAFQM